MSLTESQKAAYIAKPKHCPYCQGENINAGHINAEGALATCAVICDDCGKDWTDVYKLVKILS